MTTTTQGNVGPLKADGVGAMAASSFQRWGWAEFSGHGTVPVGIQFPAGQVEPGSVVLASITEIVNGAPLLGSAAMTVNNVVPGQDVVWFRADIDWPSDLKVRVSYYIAN